VSEQDGQIVSYSYNLFIRWSFQHVATWTCVNKSQCITELTVLGVT